MELKKMQHVGICVHHIDDLIEKLEKTVGVNSVSIVEMPARFQRSAYVKIGQANDVLEIMEPMGTDGTVYNFLEKHGEGIHHLSFKVDSVEETAAAFEAIGCKIIGRGQGVAFVHPKTNNGILYELVDDTYK